MRRRFLQPLLLAIAVLAVVAVFLAPADRARLLVDLVTGLAWPLVLAAVVVVFWPQLKPMAETLVSRVQGGAAVEFGGLISVGTLPQEAAKIPSPPPAAPVELANIALLHTSFVRPDKTRQFNDGMTYYQIEVIVMAPDAVLRRIVRVTYELQKEWEANIRPVEDRASRFKLKELANGTSIIRARVDLEGQDQPVLLNRFIDLRPDGPRI